MQHHRNRQIPNLSRRERNGPAAALTKSGIGVEGTAECSAWGCLGHDARLAGGPEVTVQPGPSGQETLVHTVGTCTGSRREEARTCKERPSRDPP